MSFCIELFCVVTLQYQILVMIAIAYFMIEKKKAAPQPWQAIAQRFCSIVIYSLAIVLIWQFVGQYVIIMMAGFQNVDTSLMEAAKIDGASYSQTVRYVTLPLMKPTLSVCVTLCVSGCMKLFDTIYAMTGGGPGRSSTVTALYAYDVAFKTKQLSYASAVSIGMIILSVILIGGVSRIFREKEEQ